MNILRTLTVLLLVVGCQGGPSRTFAPQAPAGNPAVYSEIASTSDCDDLQAMFDAAAANNDAAEPGTDAHRWSTGYMVAINDRMQAVGCY